MFLSLAIDIVSFIFAAITLFVYFKKKNSNKNDNQIVSGYFKIIVVSTFLLGLYNIASIYVIKYFLDDYPAFVEIFCRMNIIFDLFLMSIMVLYVYSSTIRKDISNDNLNGKRLLGISLTVFDTILYFISLKLDLHYFSGVNKDYIFMGGPAYFTVYGAGIICTVLLAYTLWKYMNTSAKNLKLAIVVFYFLYVIALVVQFGFLVSNIYWLFSFLVLGMFFTVESQDTKLLHQAVESREKAEIMNKAKSDFLTSVSHEIRTPMNTILGYSQVLLNEENLTEEIVKRDVVDIKDAGTHLLDLINNILDISRIESGKEVVEEREYRIEDLLLEINSLMCSKISRDVLDFSINVDANIPTTYSGDSDKIFRILVNVLDNAITHTKFGSVALNVGGAYVDNKFKLSLIVSNTGHEMQEADFNKTFEDFSRDSLNYGSSSIMLGLIVAKDLVNLLGGSIEFRNEKGKGTRYFISFDQNVVDDMKIGAISFDNFTKKENNLVNFAGMKCLVVDDNAVNVKLAVRLLEQFGLETTSASNGSECIELVKSKNYNIIFLDHMMPGLDGIATVHILRDNGCTIPIIALTANSYSGSRQKYISEGFTDYLPKPFRYKDLKKILERYLD